jgi:hypothetical protein
MIKIARNGVEIGEYEPGQLETLINQDVLRITDHYWKEGMTEWMPVDKILTELVTQKKAHRSHFIKLAAMWTFITAVVTLGLVFSMSALDEVAKSSAASREREAVHKRESDILSAAASREREAVAERVQEAQRLANIDAHKKIDTAINPLLKEFIVTPPDKFKQGSLAWYTHKDVEKYWRTNLRIHVRDDGYFYFETILNGYFSEGHRVIHNDSFTVLINGQTFESGLGDVQDVEISDGSIFERVAYKSETHQKLARLIADACAKGTKVEFRMKGKTGKFRDKELTAEDAHAISQSIKLADLVSQRSLLSGK